MSARVPGRSERKGWHLRAASSPAKPVALDGRSARGLLALLEGRDDEAAISAREALAGALAGGDMNATRAAMDRARALVVTSAEPSGLGVGDFVAVPDPAVRGGYAYRRIVALAWPDIEIDKPLSYVPTMGAVLPLPENAPQIRAKALAVFDALGPGKGTGRSLRYPEPSAEKYPSILYRNSLVAALMGAEGLSGLSSVSGVEAVEVTLVGASDPEKIVPAAKALVTCGALRILPPAP